jgi:hypothetical protein
MKLKPINTSIHSLVFLAYVIPETPKDSSVLFRTLGDEQNLETHY